jgi:hypothetical protein
VTLTRTWAASDPAGNTNTCSQSVTLVDTTGPVVLIGPANLTLIAGLSCTAVMPDLTAQLVVVDCSAYEITQTPAAGGELGVGEYPLTFNIRDVASNATTFVRTLVVAPPAGGETNISISEFMAKNTVSITDDFGLHSDWIEIRNAGNCSVNLDGWALTDEATNLTKWRFPATNIASGQFLVVWASDKNLLIPGSPLHTNFKLSDGGEYLALVQPDGATIATQFSPTFPPQLPDVSYGLPASGGTNNFLAWPTPGSANSPGTNFMSGATNIIISEFMAKNTFTLIDENGAFSDWIEIQNVGCCPINLDNWALTDDPSNLTQWRFPATNIDAGQFIVVWASGKNRRTPGKPLHTNFKLADEGEYLALVQPDGTTIATQFSPTFPPQLPDVSYGLPAGSGTNNYLALPTPGSSNALGTNFLVANLEFSPGRGWYTNLVIVSIASSTPGVTIYYTTNGTVPGPTNGFVYTSPLPVSTTTVLRAGAYRTAFLPNITTHTYVFPRQVVLQTGAGFPTNWGLTSLGDGTTNLFSVPAYYTCNSNVLNNPLWGKQMAAPLVSLPTLSVAMNVNDMFGTNGIYSNPFGDGIEWERPCSVEYFCLGQEQQFQINCGIRMHGEASRDPIVTPKHSLRLLFKRMYGAAPLAFDLYPGSPVREFDSLVLHASFDDHWFGAAGAVAQMHRDQWCADTQQETGGFGTHAVYVHLYINGLYWGVFNFGERADIDYAANYLGGRPADYDLFQGNELKDGTTNALHELLTLASAGITNDLTWSNVCYYLDMPTFVDYLMINWYIINHDWIGHNYYLEGSVTRGVPFHFISWDAETSFDVFGVLRTEYPNFDYPIIGLTEAGIDAIGVLYSSLRQYPEFRRLFGDHAQRLLFNRGALTPERGAARWMKRAREIDTSIIAESVRWGITNWWASSVWGGDWKLNTHDDWLAEQTYLMTNWFPRRTDILIGQLRTNGLYPALDAPVFSPHGGIIVESLPVTITTPPGTVLYYTTNGADPRLPDGAASPEAMVYDQGLSLTLTLTNSGQLRARAFATNSWSAVVEADYSHSNEVELRIDKITRQSGGAVKLDFLTWPGASYTLRAATHLQTSTSANVSASDFSGWETVATVVPFADGSSSFVDTAATNYPVRFYRLTWP